MEVRLEDRASKGKEILLIGDVEKWRGSKVSIGNGNNGGGYYVLNEIGAVLTKEWLNYDRSKTALHCHFTRRWFIQLVWSIQIIRCQDASLCLRR
jgi:hypothetical protein